MITLDRIALLHAIQQIKAEYDVGTEMALAWARHRLMLRHLVPLVPSGFRQLWRETHEREAECPQTEIVSMLIGELQRYLECKLTLELRLASVEIVAERELRISELSWTKQDVDRFGALIIVVPWDRFLPLFCKALQESGGIRSDALDSAWELLENEVFSFEGREYSRISLVPALYRNVREMYLAAPDAENPAKQIGFDFCEVDSSGDPLLDYQALRKLGIETEAEQLERIMQEGEPMDWLTEKLAANTVCNCGNLYKRADNERTLGRLWTQRGIVVAFVTNRINGIDTTPPSDREEAEALLDRAIAFLERQLHDGCHGCKWTIRFYHYIRLGIIENRAWLVRYLSG